MKTRNKPGRQWKSLGLIVALLLGFSLYEHGSTGTIAWPREVAKRFNEQLSDYAGRPEAGWRRAADTLETLGAAREGNPVPDFDFTGRVVRVSDGDTVSILDEQNQQHKVRLYGIDAPETDQPHGSDARRALARLIDNRHVGVVIIETDSYGRKVATLYRDATNINLTMVEGGHAWWYRFYAPNNPFLELAEASARKQDLGLWDAPSPTPPWDWRRQRY